MEQEKNLTPIETSEETVEMVETVETNEVAKGTGAMAKVTSFLKKMWYYIHDVFYINTLCKKWKFDKWKAWVYLAPAIILLLIFTVWPIFNTLRMAFSNNYSTIGEMEWLESNDGSPYPFTFGFENFKMVVTYLGFTTALKNTILLTIITVPLSTALALLIAVCLNAIRPLRRFLQTIFFLPYVTNSIAIGMVFAAMFSMTVSPDGVVQTAGLLNNLLELFGIEPINWMNQGSTYMANVIVMVVYIVWNALPFKILILLGGLQSVNKQYYEAAKIDSTPRWRVFLKITVPLLSPMIAYVVITGFIGGFKEYSSIVGVFGDKMGAPGDPLIVSTDRGQLNTMVGYIYDCLNGQGIGAQGRASAAALILFGIIFIVTMINLYVSKKKTHY